MSSPYFRFVVDSLDADSGRFAGIFQLLDHVPRRALSPRALRRIRAEYDWMNRNLPVARLDTREPHAIFWFKPGAGEPLRRMRDFATWLRAQGLPVDNVKTTAPGRVVYEDPFQVGAIPETDGDPSRRYTVGIVTVQGRRARFIRRP